MVSVVFDCEFDPETLKAIQDLRKIRRKVLVEQIRDIGGTLESLVQMGALKSSERMSYQKDILADLNAKIEQLDKRIEEESTIFSDELEMYLDLLSNP